MDKYMPSKLFLLNCRHRYPWLLLITLQLSILVLSIYSHTLCNWAKSSDLSLGAFKVKQDETQINLLQDRFTCDESQVLSSKLCESVSSMKRSVTPVLLSLVSGDILLLLWISTSFSFLIQRNFYKTGCFLGFFATFSLSSGPIAWLIQQEVQLFPCNSSARTCKSIDKGFMLNLAVVLLALFTHYFFFIIGRVSLIMSRVGYTRANELNSLYSTVRNYSDTKAVTGNLN